MNKIIIILAALGMIMILFVLTKWVQQFLALPYIQKIDTVELDTNENKCKI